VRVDRYRAAVCAVILTMLVAAVAAQSPGRWLMQKGAPVPTPEEEYWNATANGKLYMMGGNQGGKNDRVLEYDIAADKWTTKKPAPWSANHMALAEYRGKIYVFGGATVESQPNALKSWEYDPAADSWKELPPMPSKRTASVAN
jgi:N-acetylneuraminic acid mutarotase